MNIYFDKEEEAFIRAQEKGWVRELVHQAILRHEFNPAAPTIRTLVDEVADARRRMEEEKAREHFPPEVQKDPTIWNPQKDVFGPRLKR